MGRYWFQKLPRIFIMLLILGLVVGLTPSDVQAKEKKVVRVAFPELEGFTETGTDGKPHGLVVDYLEEIAKYTGWEYEYVKTTGETLFDDFQAGKFDLVGGTYYMPEMEEYYVYPDYNTGYSKSVLLARKDDSSVISYDLEKLSGKTIGVYENAKENVRRLKVFLEINNMDCKLKYYKYEDLSEDGNLYAHLENKEVDLLLGNSGDIKAEFRVAAIYDAQPYYIITTVGNQEILDGLNHALARILDSDPDFAEECYNANFPNAHSAKVQLNDSELNYVKEKGTVTVAVPLSWRPLFYVDGDGTEKGLVVDILKRVHDYTGLDFKYVYADTYMDAIQLVQQGEAEVLGFFLGDDRDAERNDLAQTKEYATMTHIVVRNKSVSFPSEGLVGAVINGRQLPENIRAAEVVVYDNITDALADVNRGKVDFVYGVSSRMEQEIQQHHFSNLIPVTLVNISRETGFAMASPVDPDLMTLMNKAIYNISAEDKVDILNKNLISIGDDVYTLTDMLYANPVLFVTIVSAILLLALGVVLLIVRFRMRAVAMQADLERAEAKSRAKGEFLSRMSHEIRTPMNAVIGLTDLTSMMEEVPENVQANLRKLRSSSHYLLSLLNDILDMSQLENGMLKIAEEPFSMNRMLDRLQSMMTAEANRCGLHFTMEKEITQDGLTGDVIRLQQVLTNLLSNAFKFTSPGGHVSLQVRQMDEDESGAAYQFRVMDDGVGIPKEDQKRIFDEFEQVGSNYSRSQGTGLGLSISYRIVRLMGGELQLDSQPGEGSEFFFTIRFPYGKLEEKPEEMKNVNLLAGVHVLLAEDNDLNAEIAIQLLEMQGAEVDRACDGKQAMEMFTASKAEEYQVILMDIQMPQMNGLEATRAIRKSDHPKAGTIPIIAMTANSFKEDTEAAAVAGMNGFVSKPLDVNYLYGILHRAVKKE
ncbi:MAG: ATP-binding protein [Blautia sp.]|jgi:signal transduction histidine kinase/ActR/RegA family two-component response regulator